MPYRILKANQNNITSSKIKIHHWISSKTSWSHSSAGISVTSAARYGECAFRVWVCVVVIRIIFVMSWRKKKLHRNEYLFSGSHKKRRRSANSGLIRFCFSVSKLIYGFEQMLRHCANKAAFVALASGLALRENLLLSTSARGTLYRYTKCHTL